jgi:hypothetical protein
VSVHPHTFIYMSKYSKVESAFVLCYNATSKSLRCNIPPNSPLLCWS